MEVNDVGCIWDLLQSALRAWGLPTMELSRPTRWTARNATIMGSARLELVALGSEIAASIPAVDHHHLAVTAVVAAMRPSIRAKNMKVSWVGLTIAKATMYSYLPQGGKLRLRKDIVLVAAHDNRIHVKWWYGYFGGFGVQDANFDLRNPDSVDLAAECAVAHVDVFQPTIGRLEAEAINARAAENALRRFTPRRRGPS